MKRIEHQKTASPTTVLLFSGAIVLQIVGMSLFPLTAGLYEVLAHTGFHPGLIARLIAFLPDALQRCRTQFSDTVRFSSHTACREHAGNIRVRGKYIGIENHAAYSGLRPDRHRR